MRFRSWLAICSANSESTIPFSKPETSPSPTKLETSDTSSTSDVPSTSTSASDTSSSSLQSNLSLQTLPSVVSLQKLSPLDALDLSVSHLCFATLRPRRPSLPITCLAIHHNLLYAASGHEINVYDRTTHALHDSFNADDASSGSVKSVNFSNRNIFTSHQDSKIRVWQLTVGKRHKLLNSLPTVNDRLRRFVLPKNYVTVRRHKKCLWIQHADAVTGIAVNNGLIYSVSWDKSLKIWRDSDLRCLESVKAHEDAVNAVAVSNDGTVYTGSADCRIRVWAKPFGEKRHVLVATLEKHKSAVNALALNDDGSVLFSGACDRSILVWEREDSANHMAVTGALRGHRKAILCMINVGDLLFSGSADRTVRVWQRGEDGSFCCLAVLEGHVKPVKSLVAVKDEESSGVVTVYSGSLDGEVKVWHVSVSNVNSSPGLLSELQM
ncbi:protein JINGUBANG-like [Pyrus x bretschneideri]|uniref:protein JINGUBANG-like n=1 Tax=Pyrus x bretschneideri TaxID=225117 RepID=UPI000510A17D|nr:protein JINGUBANG-like [Pyrus x bretschneideri]